MPMPKLTSGDVITISPGPLSVSMSGPIASSSLVLVSAGVDIGVQMFVSTLSTVVWLTRSLQNPLKICKKIIKTITLLRLAKTRTSQWHFG